MKSKGLKILCLLSLLCPMIVLGQDSLGLTSRKYIARNSFLIGTSSGGVMIYTREPITNKRYFGSQIQIDPRIAYFPIRSLAIGATYTYGWRAGNIFDHLEWHEVGAFARFYFFMKNRDRLLGVDTGNPPSKLALFQKSKPDTRHYLALNIFPFAEFTWSYGNLRQELDGSVSTFARLSAPALYFRVGFNARF